MEKFNFKMLNEKEVKKHSQVTITNNFAVLENLQDNANINRARNIFNRT
jgi:hypothetical protein